MSEHFIKKRRNPSPIIGGDPSVIVYGRASLKETLILPAASIAVDQMIDTYNEGRERSRPTVNQAAELKTSSDQDIEEVVRYLAAPLLNSYGLQTALIDSRKASRTERRTERTLDDVEAYVGIGKISCAIVAWGYDADEKGYEIEHNIGSIRRADEIKSAVLGHHIPVMELEIIPVSRYIIDRQQEPDAINRLHAEEGLFVPPAVD